MLCTILWTILLWCFIVLFYDLTVVHIHFYMPPATCLLYVQHVTTQMSAVRTSSVSLANASVVLAMLGHLEDV